MEEDKTWISAWTSGEPSPKQYFSYRPKGNRVEEAWAIFSSSSRTPVLSTHFQLDLMLHHPRVGVRLNTKILDMFQTTLSKHPYEGTCRRDVTKVQVSYIRSFWTSVTLYILHTSEGKKIRVINEWIKFKWMSELVLLESFYNKHDIIQNRKKMHLQRNIAMLTLRNNIWIDILNIKYKHKNNRLFTCRWENQAIHLLIFSCYGSDKFL